MKLCVVEVCKMLRRCRDNIIDQNCLSRISRYSTTYMAEEFSSVKTFRLILFLRSADGNTGYSGVSMTCHRRDIRTSDFQICLKL